MPSQPRPAPAVVFFDIDGTLVRKSGPHHRQALESAVQRVTGLCATTDGIPVQGMLDLKIFEMMLRNAGATPALIARAMPDLVREAQWLYRRRSPPSLRDKVCPGARSALRRLRRRGVPLGLVTGNLTAIGWRKLERAGLRHYFQFGAFAERAGDRAGLLRVALAHARRRGWIGVRTRLWLIGDHENDVRAAQANAVNSVAVATGLSSAGDLASCSPTILLNSLTDLDLEVILNS